MTRTATADAVVSACPRPGAAAAVTATRPVAAGTAIAFTGPVPEAPRTRRPGWLGSARTPLLCHLPGAPHQPELRRVRPLGRLLFPGDAVTPAGWPADPGRDV
jgi:hypothetical protein